MRTSALFGAKKTAIFRNLWCVRSPHGQRGWGLRQCRHFSEKRGRGDQFFAILWGRPLWTAPNLILEKSRIPCSGTTINTYSVICLLRNYLSK